MQPRSAGKKTPSCQNLGSVLILWMDVRLTGCHQVNLFLLQDQFSCQIVYRLGGWGRNDQRKIRGAAGPAKECIKEQPTCCGNCSSQRETLNPRGLLQYLCYWNPDCSPLATNGWQLCWKQHTCWAVGLIKGWIVSGLNTSAIIAAALRDFRGLCSPGRGWEQPPLCLGINLHAVCVALRLFVLFESFWGESTVSIVCCIFL